MQGLTPEGEESEGRGEAQRVILRFCEDVEKRFSEPIFAKSMLRDHIPTNCELSRPPSRCDLFTHVLTSLIWADELCMSLLSESVLPRIP